MVFLFASSQGLMAAAAGGATVGEMTVGTTELDFSAPGLSHRNTGLHFAFDLLGCGPMRFIAAIVKGILAVALGLVVFVVAAFALVVGAVAVLVLGRKAKFQIYRGGMGMDPRRKVDPFNEVDPFGPRPPMRDVTPIKPQELK